MRVLVTGSAGFIGSHLVKKLQAAGHDVCPVDIRETPSVDILDAESLFEHARLFRPHTVVHLAALMPPGVNEEQLCRTNVVGTQSVLDVAKALHVHKVVFASSAAVYGDGETREDADLHPVSAYGLSKLAGEHLIRQETTLDHVILRFFNVYGERGHGVVDILKQCMVTGDTFTLTNEGQAIRDFIHVEELVDVLIQALDLSGVTCNVGTGIGTRISDLAHLAQDMSSFDMVVHPKVSGEIQTSIADTAVRTTLLPFNSCHSVTEYLQGFGTIDK